MKTRKVETAVFFGTSAELIKLWPVITELEKLTAVSLLTTNQQPIELRELEQRLNLKSVINLRSPQKGNLTSKVGVIPWIISVMTHSVRRLLKLKKAARKNKKNLLVFVHGDTMTCVVGALAARITRCQVVHVEAGLRSNDWRNPFPEEIDRIVTARLAQYHYSPDEIAVKNLSGRKGTVVNTGGNTARDSMRLMQDVVNRKDDGEPFTLVSLHRAELLGNESVLISTIKELIECSSNNRLVMVIDALTRSTLEQLNLLGLLQASSIELHEKMAYPDFLEFVIGAERVVTDSGGLQEECGFLEIPCLVHRKATERFDGIGQTARLSMWKAGAIREFVSMNLLQSRSNEQMRRLSDDNSPTEVIIQSLTEMKLL